MEALGTILIWVALVVWGLSAWYVMGRLVSDGLASGRRTSLWILFLWPLALVGLVGIFPVVVAVILFQMPRSRGRRR